MTKERSRGSLGLDLDQEGAERYSRWDTKIRVGVFSEGSLTGFQMQHK